ncbi:YdcF family protein [Clostridium baratii]|uniref:YdcF family protein n=1 Tax=Clostridium nitritogenes TaxID=83340 RepID=A0ABN1LUA0_9CLOT|nr:YdcF family protein [Clostridium baratii]MBS6043600.1 YdcF family protein [Clostridium baratii]MBT9830374.1 YdcF family protein [Clostridium baratii]STB71404.1 GdmH [Clostridium baratii]
MIVLFILGILCVSYFILVNLVFGYTTFSAFYLILGALILVYYFFHEKINAYIKTFKFFKPFKILFFICVAIFLITEACILMYSKSSTEKADYIVVLGAGVRGENITTTLKDRLDSTLEFIKKTDYKGDVVVSGGMGPGEDITEAEAMRRYLVKNGLDNNRIILEDRATSTYENFKYSKDIIEKISSKNIDALAVTFITTDFHALRSNMIAKRNGYKNINSYTSRTKWYLVPSMYAREFFAFYKSIIFDR